MGVVLESCGGPKTFCKFQGAAVDFVDGSEKMAGWGDLTHHRLTPPTVYLNGDRAVVAIGAAIDSRFTVHGVEAE